MRSSTSPTDEKSEVVKLDRIEDVERMKDDVALGEADDHALTRKVLWKLDTRYVCPSHHSRDVLTIALPGSSQSSPSSSSAPF